MDCSSLCVLAELSHQQSREIEQHHAQFGSRGPLLNSATAPAVDGIQRAARRTADEFNRFTSTVYDAAKTAWDESLAEQERQRQYSMLQQQNPATTYLDDFGIPKDDALNEIGGDVEDAMAYAPLNSQEQHQRPPLQTTQQQTMQQQSPRGDFVVLPRFRRPQASAEGWGAAANLDLYFSSLYSFFYQRGLLPLVCKGVVELLTLFMTLALSIVLFVYVDWVKLSSCIDESTCEADFVTGYIVRRPFAKRSTWNFVVTLYVIIFCAYGMFSAWSFFRQIQDACKYPNIFEHCKAWRTSPFLQLISFVGFLAVQYRPSGFLKSGWAYLPTAWRGELWTGIRTLWKSSWLYRNQGNIA